MTDHAEYAAGAQLRTTLEAEIMPMVGRLLGGTQDGHPLPACEHLDSGRLYLDQHCGRLFCAECAGSHVAEFHGFPPCAVCGLPDDGSLRGWAVGIALGAPVLCELPTGEVVAWLGSLATLPIAAECAAHDGFLDGEATVLWSPRPVAA